MGTNCQYGLRSLLCGNVSVCSHSSAPGVSLWEAERMPPEVWPPRAHPLGFESGKLSWGEGGGGFHS